MSLVLRLQLISEKQEFEPRCTDSPTHVLYVLLLKPEPWIFIGRQADYLLCISIVFFQDNAFCF